MDSDLEKHITTPLETTKGAKTDVQIEDENEMSDDDVATDGSISRVTRDAIYGQLASAKQDDPYIDPKKVMTIKNMTEAEGLSYLEVLRSQRCVAFSRSVSKKLVGVAVGKLCHPRDKCTPVLASSDQSMIDELANSLGWVFSHLGNLKAYAMLGIYIASSWTKNWDDQFVQWTENKHLEDTLGNGGKQPESTTSAQPNNAAATV